MSYILDALKRSELQRNATRIPTVAAPQGVLVERARRPRVALLVAAILAASIVAGGGWWWARSTPVQRVGQVSDAAPTPAIVSSEVPRAAQVEAPAPAGPSDSSRATAPEPLPRLKLAVSMPSSREREVVVLPPDTSGRTRAAISGETVAKSPEVNAPTHPSAGRFHETISYNDLPQAIRQSLPRLAINGFAAGEGGEAMVMVDDRLLREGDDVAPGLRLERIHPDGTEFSYKGYRFRR